MKTFIIIIIIITILSIKSHAQLDFFIKEMNVSNIDVKISKNIIISGQDDGPIVSGYYYLKNNTDSLCLFNFPKSKFILTFKYKGTDYLTDVLVYDEFLEKEIQLLPGQEKEGYFSTHLLLGTNLDKGLIFNKNEDYKLDYTKELIEILPTIRLWYRDGNYNIKTSAILNVNANL